MKKKNVLCRIVSFALSLVLVLASLGIAPTMAYAKETDDSLATPFGQVAEYDASQGIGFVWGAAGYEAYTVTISSDNGYMKVYEDQALGYHWYPDTYPAGTYDIYLQGQFEDRLSPGCHAEVTVPGENVGNESTDSEEPVIPDSGVNNGNVPENNTSYANFELVTKSTYASQADGGWGGDANVQFKFEGTKATISADSFGGNAWAVQWGLNEFNADGDINALEFDVTATVDGTLKYKFFESAGMADIAIKAGDNHIVLKTDLKTVNPFFDLSFLGAGEYVIENMEFVKSVADPVDETVVIDNDSFLFNGDVNIDTYSSEVDGYWGGNSHVDFDFADGFATIKADSFGWNAWAVQWKLLDMTSASDNNIFAFDVVSSSDKSFIVKNEVSGAMTTVTVKAGEKYHYCESVNTETLSVTFDLTGGAGELKFSNVKFAPVMNMEYADFETYTSESDGGWGGDSGVRFVYNNTTATVSANSFGWNAWAVQWKAALTSSMPKNTFEFDVTASEDKNIAFKNEGTQAMTTLKLKAGVPYHYTENVDGNTITFTFDLTGGAGILTFANMKFGDAGLSAPEKEPAGNSQHDFSDPSGDNSDPGIVKEGYTLIWADEFDGNYKDDKVDAETGLNLNNWAYQLGDGTTDCGNTGWGNAELQCYTGNSKNIAVNEDLTGDGNKDGMLRITASYEDNGYKYAGESVKKYTSARIRTTSPDETLFTTTYGYVEARIALPEVRGAWPAFWMLPESTEIYGGWPVSGELDILETTGTRKDEACGTLHWGTPAHVYRGSGYVKLNSEVKYFHTYAVDWEPGKITWLYDGEPIHTATDWASAFGGASDSLTFDAPFDMPYYVILNLAVDSGNFGGTANKANFTDDINMYIDYVRVFQKEEGYADSAVRTAGEVNEDWTNLVGKNLIADITADNLITTGMDDANSDMDSWYMTTQSDASATARVFADDNGQVWHKVSVGSQGANDYSVQLIGHYDAKKGYVYKVSFEAYAEGGMVGKTVNCDTKEWAGWSTGGIKQVTLTDAPSSYSYTFAEKADFDNCRVEFNIGSVGTGDVYISKVKVEVVDPALLGVSESGRQALTDGNMIYNSKFTEGTGHLGFWTVGENTKVSVPRFTLTDLTGKDVRVLDIASKTNCEKIEDGIKYYERRAEISSVEGSAPSIIQTGIPMTADTYTVKLDMYSENNTAVKVAVLDKEGKEVTSKAAAYDANDGVRTYTFVLTTDKDIDEGSLCITFAKGANVQLDNVIMKGANQKSAFDENPLNTGSTWGGDNGNGGKLETIVGGTTVSVVNATSGGTWYSPQVVSEDFAIGGNIEYKLRFKLKINDANNGTFEYAIQENGGSWAFAKSQTKVNMADLNTDANGYSVYETTFTSAATISNAHFIFGFGNSAINNATIVLDEFDLSIVKAAPSEGGSSDDAEVIDDSLFNEITSEDNGTANSGTADNGGDTNNNGNSGNSSQGNNSTEAPAESGIPVNGDPARENPTVEAPSVEEPETFNPVEETVAPVEETIQSTAEAEEISAPDTTELPGAIPETGSNETVISEEETPLAPAPSTNEGPIIWIILGALVITCLAVVTGYEFKFKKKK